MEGGDGGRQKNLKQDSRNQIYGTYHAEQISNLSFDLVATGAAQSRTHIGRAGALSPSPEGPSLQGRRRKKASSKLHLKTKNITKLPALENIDTLFKEREDDGKGTDAADGTQLKKIVESPSDDEDDADFKEWLTLPSVQGSPRDGSESSWHLLISRKTFNSYSDQHVAAALMQVLGFDAHEARDRVIDLRKRRLVMLEESSDKGEAFRKLQKLRSLGLQVQVVLNFGLPGDGRFRERKGRRRSSGHHVSAQDRSYTELFYRAGAKKSNVKWVQAPAGKPGSKMRAGLAQWRFQQSEDFEQCILPEDPVTALFSKDIEERKVDKLSSGGSLLKAMLNKYQGEFKERYLAGQRENLRRLSGQGGLLGSRIMNLAHKNKHRDILGVMGTGAKIAETILEVMRQSPVWDEKKEASAAPAAPGTESNNSTSFAHQGQKQVIEATRSRKDACLLFRFFVYGSFVLDDTKDKEREAIFHESIGTKDQVKKLHALWSKLDYDNSGRVDFQEFRAFAEQHIREIVEQHAHSKGIDLSSKNDKSPRGGAPKRSLHHHLAIIVLRTESVSDLIAQAIEDTQKFSHSLCEKLSVALLGKKSSFVIEDMMRLIWLGAAHAEIRTMKLWCRDFYEEAVRNRVETPPVLDEVEYEGLCSVFEHFDENHEGEILFDTLVTKGLIYTEQIEEYRKAWDENGDGVLSQQEFCDMMCPVGFRASSGSEIGTRPDGRRVLYDPAIGGWKLEETSWEIHPEFVMDFGSRDLDNEDSITTGRHDEDLIM